jgi:hypothetical protein
MRGSALTHSGPVQSPKARVTYSQQPYVERVSSNIYYFNNTWTKSRGLDTLDEPGSAKTALNVSVDETLTCGLYETEVGIHHPHQDLLPNNNDTAA